VLKNSVVLPESHIELTKGPIWFLPEALAPHTLASSVAAQVCNVTKISHPPHVSFCSVHPLPGSETVSENIGIPQKMNAGHELLKTSINIYRMNNIC